MKISDDILRVVREAHTIAVVGLSANPARPSFGVVRIQRFSSRGG